MLNEAFWDNRYINNDTGWDMKQVSPPLKSIIDSLNDKHLKILIPGCGNAYEAASLALQGFTNVTLIDIAPTLINRLKKQFSDSNIQIVLGDFFDHQGGYDLILEQTFFCALNPKLRPDYVHKCFELLNQSGSLRGVLFNINFENDGPPFGGTQSEYESLFSPSFYLEHIDICQNSIEKRQGNELLINFKTTKK
ncbi:MAG TPA: methyltransferase domain-containing protein [Flavipsychrobacter sp.]|jgi:hypothetical protein|nr:methyltransferase domain-containing protein [Flavipsychrobacter sp.]